MNARKFVTACLLFVLNGTYSEQAAITEISLFELGETDSFAGGGGGAQDNIGGRHFTSGTGLGVSYIFPSPYSSCYSRFNGVNDLQYGADFAALPINNFAVELWVRTSNTNQSAGLFATGKTIPAIYGSNSKTVLHQSFPCVESHVSRGFHLRGNWCHIILYST